MLKIECLNRLILVNFDNLTLNLKSDYVNSEKEPAEK